MFNEWYLARNKDYCDNAVQAHPTELKSITKHTGCIEYHANPGIWVDGRETNGGPLLTPKQCKRIFGHCPKKGELLCVKKTRKGWKSTKIELEFSE